MRECMKKRPLNANDQSLLFWWGGTIAVLSNDDQEADAAILELLQGVPSGR